MSYTLTTEDNGHIIVLTMGEDFAFPTEMIEALTKVYEHMESGPHGIVMVVDNRKLKFETMEKILQSGQSARSPESTRVHWCVIAY